MSYFRASANAPGVSYDATKLDVLYSEDIEKIYAASTLLRNVVFSPVSAGIPAGVLQTVHSFTLPPVPIGYYCEIEMLLENTNNIPNWGCDINCPGGSLVGNTGTTQGYWKFLAKIYPTDISGMRQTWKTVTDGVGVVPVDGYAQINQDFSSSVTITIDVKNNAGTTKTFKVLSLITRIYIDDQ